MKFTRKFLQNLACEDHDPIIVELIKDEICDHTRWSVGHDVIFKVLATNKFYSTYYSRGATEYQDESPYECEPAEIECAEVIPKKVEVIQYVTVKENISDKGI